METLENNEENMNNENLVYRLVILRKDFQHIEVLKTENYEEARGVWRELADRYKTSATDNVPFEMEEPIVSSFDPGLIAEITIQAEPKQTTINKLGEHNPYVDKMKKQGLAETLKIRGQTGEILDGGYK